MTSKILIILVYLYYSKKSLKLFQNINIFILQENKHFKNFQQVQPSSVSTYSYINTLYPIGGKKKKSFLIMKNYILYPFYMVIQFFFTMDFHQNLTPQLSLTLLSVELANIFADSSSVYHFNLVLGKWTPGGLT